ncbi:MAG: TonB-dependent receptor, partial [Nitrospirota bacterium]|nr:TonB-dependent receptor [Nitrospirota bacterium]
LEDLIEVTSRRPTKIKHVAENISIITAEEIRQMNAHSVNEILRIVTGMHIDFNEYFAGTGVNSIHTSKFFHNLILLDGVRINEVGEGYTVTTGIPVQIIDRIEIVKGPASSAWGSALGGVINIITKNGKEGSRPTGTLYGSFGEHQSWDLRADAGGGSDTFRYYLYAGKLETDGLVTADASFDRSPDRFAESENVYAKVNYDPSKDIALTFSAGYWRDRHLNIIVPALDWQDPFGVDAYFVRGNLDAALSPDLKFKLNLYYFDQRLTDHYDVMGTGIAGNAGDFYQEYIYDNYAYGGDTSLTWDKGRHSMLLGAEYYYGEMNASARYGAYRQSLGFPPQEDTGEGDVAIPSVYVNDTIKWDRFTITPGLRYDHLDIAGIVREDQLNPSLGMTYRISEKTLVRATVARGFARPSVYGVAGFTGRVPLPGNPDIESSVAWSYQAGIESGEIEKLHLKADIFYHRLDKTFIFDAATMTYENGGKTEKKGFEVNAVAGPFKNITTHLGFTYVWQDELNNRSDEFYCLNAKLRYADKRIGNLTLFGQYLWLGRIQSSQSGSPRYDDMLWDLHYNKDIFVTEKSRTNFFFSVRNLFNGANYDNNSFLNPDRWIEAGLRIEF